MSKLYSWCLKEPHIVNNLCHKKASSKFYCLKISSIVRFSLLLLWFYANFLRIMSVMACLKMFFISCRFGLKEDLLRGNFLWNWNKIWSKISVLLSAMKVSSNLSTNKNLLNFFNKFPILLNWEVQISKKKLLFVSQTGSRLLIRRISNIGCSIVSSCKFWFILLRLVLIMKNCSK